MVSGTTFIKQILGKIQRQNKTQHTKTVGTEYVSIHSKDIHHNIENLNNRPIVKSSKYALNSNLQYQRPNLLSTTCTTCLSPQRKT